MCWIYIRRGGAWLSEGERERVSIEKIEDQILCRPTGASISRCVGNGVAGNEHLGFRTESGGRNPNIRPWRQTDIYASLQYYIEQVDRNVFELKISIIMGQILKRLNHFFRKSVKSSLDANAN